MVIRSNSGSPQPRSNQWSYTDTVKDVKQMIAIYYFDWKGHRDTVKKYGEKLEKACEKTGAKFLGLYGPGMDKYHFAAMVEADGMDAGYKPFTEAGRPEEMYHVEFKFFGKVYP